MFPYRFIESQKFVHTRLFAARATERVSKSNTLAYELPNGNWALSTRTLLMLVAWCVHVCVSFFLLKSLVLYTYLTGFRYHAFCRFYFFYSFYSFFYHAWIKCFFLNSFQYTLFIHGNKLLLKTYTTSLLSLIYRACVFVFHFVTTLKSIRGKNMHELKAFRETKHIKHKTWKETENVSHLNMAFSNEKWSDLKLIIQFE